MDVVRHENMNIYVTKLCPNLDVLLISFHIACVLADFRKRCRFEVKLNRSYVLFYGPTGCYIPHRYGKKIVRRVIQIICHAKSGSAQNSEAGLGQAYLMGRHNSRW